MSRTKHGFIVSHGIQAWRERSNREKRIVRLRRKMAGLVCDGGPLKPLRPRKDGRPSEAQPRERFITIDGVRHPMSCPCFDCLYGPIAELKAIASKSNGTVAEVEYRPAKTGKVPRA